MTDAEVVEVVKNTLFNILERGNVEGVIRQVENVYTRFDGEMHKPIVSWILETETTSSFFEDYIFKPIQSALGDEYIVRGLECTMPFHHEFGIKRIPFKRQLSVYRKENS